MNVSRSGALLTLDSDAIEPRRTLEFVIHLSAGGMAGMADVQCRGSIVRIQRIGAVMHVAVTIDTFHYASADGSLLRLDAQ